MEFDILKICDQQLRAVVFVSAPALSGLYLLRQVHGPIAEVWIALGNVGFQSF